MDQLQAGMNLYKFIWTNNLFAPNLCAQKRGLVTSQKGYLKGVFALRTLTGTWRRRVRGLSQEENPLGEWPWVLGIGYVERGPHSILFQYPWLLERVQRRESTPAIVGHSIDAAVGSL